MMDDGPRIPFSVYVLYYGSLMIGAFYALLVIRRVIRGKEN